MSDLLRVSLYVTCLSTRRPWALVGLSVPLLRLVSCETPPHNKVALGLLAFSQSWGQTPGLTSSPTCLEMQTWSARRK